jgi:hypothetical protein
MRPSRSSCRSLALAAFIAAPLGCGADSSSRAEPARQVLRSFAACAPAPAGQAGEAPGVPQVFVDAALFYTSTQALAAESPGRSVPIAETLEALEAADVETVSTPHVLATNGIRAEIAISGERDVRLSVLPRIEPSGAIHLQLDAEHGGGTPAAARLQASVVVEDGQVAMVHSPAPGGDREHLAMLVRPFVIRREADLARIMACKQHAARTHALAEE